MQLINWQLKYPERLPFAPVKSARQSVPVCWVVGALPCWISDLCLVLHLAEYRHVASQTELPAILPLKTGYYGVVNCISQKTICINISFPSIHPRQQNGNGTRSVNMNVKFIIPQETDLPELYDVECRAHRYPWSYQLLASNFGDRYINGALCLDGKIIGFYIADSLLDESTLDKCCVSIRHGRDTVMESSC